MLVFRLVVVILNGFIGGGILGVIYSFLYWNKKLDVVIFIIGVLGGLVGIIVICVVCCFWEVFVIGFIGGLVVCGSCDIIDRFVLEFFLIGFVWFFEVVLMLNNFVLCD